MNNILTLTLSIALGIMAMTGCAVYNPIQATNAEVPINEVKIGTATCRNFFWLISIGKCTLGDAIEKGKITQVQSADREYFSIWFYSSNTIEVRGK